MTEHRPHDPAKRILHVVPPSKRVQGGGVLGFGCGTAMALILGLALYLPTTGGELLSIVLIALTGGVLAAKFGDSFFTWTLEKVRLLFWW